MDVEVKQKTNISQENSTNKTSKQKDKDCFKTEFQIKTENLGKSIFKTTNKYKNSQKRELGLDIRRNFSTAVGYMNLGMRIPSVRKTRLQEAQAEIETIRYNLELLREVNGIGPGFWREIDLEITNISRSIGAYIKQIGKKK